MNIESWLFLLPDHDMLINIPSRTTITARVLLKSEELRGERISEKHSFLNHLNG